MSDTADCKSVATDLRNQGPTIILMCCQTEDVTHTKTYELQKQPIGNIYKLSLIHI